MNKYTFIEKSDVNRDGIEDTTTMTCDGTSPDYLVTKFHQFLVACGYQVEDYELHFVPKAEDVEDGA